MAARSGIARLRVLRDNWATASVDGTGTIGNLLDVRVMEAEPTLGLATFRDQRVVARLTERPLDSIGFKSGGLQLTGHLVSTGTAADASTAVPTTTLWDAILYAIAGGSETPGTGGQGSLVAAGTSVQQIDVTASQGARFSEGSIVLVETGVSTGLYQAARVQSVSTDTLVFAVDLSFTPSVGARVLNTRVVYEANTTGDETLQFLWEGEDRDDIWLLMGCFCGDLQISWQSGQELTWSTTITAADWEHDDNIATPQGGSALASATHTGSGPVIAKAGNAVFGPNTGAGSTRVTPAIDAFTFTPNLTRQVIESLNGVNGIGGHERVRAEPATLVVELPFTDETYHDARDARTEYYFMAQAQNVGGSTVVLECPSLQIVNVEKFLRNGLRYLRLTCMCREDSTITSPATGVETATWRLAGG